MALPHARAAKLIAALDGAAAARAGALRDAPIVNLHVVYDRVVCDQPFAAGVRNARAVRLRPQRRRRRGGGTPVPRGVALGRRARDGDERGRAARALHARARRAPAAGARGARIERFLATREHAATFRAQPRSAALRCGPRTARPGLALAGAWTATGWPATLEGAVLSGHAAARCALQAL